MTGRCSPLAALYRLGLDVADIALMRADLLAAIKRSNNDLIHSFGTRPLIPKPDNLDPAHVEVAP